MKNSVFWDMAPCGSRKKIDVSEVDIASIFRAEKIREQEKCFSHTSKAIGSQMAVRLSAHAQAALYSEILFSFFWYSFLLVAE
jgi:hypothetical protein